MTVYATFDADGFVMQMWDGADPAPIPAAAVALSDADLLRLVTAPGGWQRVGGQLSAYAAPMVAPAPPDISDRQFARGLWGAGIISYSDFLGFVGPGSIPSALQAIVNTLPDDDTGAPTPRKEAIGYLTGAKTYSYANPLVEELRQAMAATDARWTADYLRAQWLTWATL